MQFKQKAITVNINGKDFNIFYDLNAYSELENRYGSIDKAMDELSKGSLKALRIILWAGLIHDNTVFDDFTGEPVSYGITIGEVGRMLSMQNMKEITENLTKAITDSMPEEDVAAKNEVTT